MGSRRAVVLVSGGLDSATALAVAMRERFECYALSFDYGQRHRHELSAAELVVRHLRAAGRQVVRFDLRAFGGSSLTSSTPVPKDRVITPDDPIPNTYVPARNTIFLSFAMAWAEVLEAADIFIGVNALDYSGYPDCRPEYIRAFEQMANLATAAGVQGRTRLTIHTPLISMTKAEIIRLGHSLGVDYGLTSSCYDPGPGGQPCGRCDSCQLRAKGFLEAGIDDPLVAVN
jgi:7-cyano-7-deazaguanine synthase